MGWERLMEATGVEIIKQEGLNVAKWGRFWGWGRVNQN